MAGINNKYDYRDGVLTALGVEHTPSDVRNEDEYRKKVLDGFGVEYTDDDINRKHLYREKVVSGLASDGGGSGGGGSSGFSTAQVTFSSTTFQTDFKAIMIYTDGGGGSEEGELEYGGTIFGGEVGDKTFNLVLYKGRQMVLLPEGKTATVTGSATVEEHYILVTGDCTITISSRGIK